MLSTYAALHAHARCKARAAAMFRRPQGGPCPEELSESPDCALVRFIDQCASKYGDTSEVRTLRAAHATVHSVLVGLAHRRMLGQAVNPDVEFAPHSNLGSASSSLVSAIWRIERRLRSMAG